MPKLTDTQLVILSAAARRQDRAVLPLPKSLKIKGSAVTKTLEGLREKGLLDEKAAARNATAWREDEDGRRMMLVITDAGLQALDAEPAGESSNEPTPSKTRAKKRGGRATRKSAAATPKNEKSQTTVRQGTKQALLINLLKRKKGATIAEIVAATGWQAHSVRGAISGALKKKLGLAVASEPVEKRGRVYRIAGCG
jgi:predicted ArsR family transcriptional regulator